MIERILDRLFAFDKIGTDEYPILYRWVIFDFSWGRLAIHHIQPGVLYRDFHDHGHFMLLLCLAGAYIDVKRVSKDVVAYDTITRGSLRLRLPPHAHKIVPAPGTGAWTICFQGPITKQEGFYVGDQWIPTEDYEASNRWPWGPMP